MKKLFIELPKYRLAIQYRMIKRRKPLIEEPIIPSPKHLKKTYRAGTFVSRYFRYILERINVKRLLGANIALVIFATNLISNNNLLDLEDALVEPVVAADTVALTTEKTAQYPLKDIRITQGYRLFHPAIDFDGEIGDPVYPIKPGKIEAIQFSKFAYGNAILVNHGNKMTSLYAHLSQINVIEGQEVGLTTEIGKVGSTGRSTGPHLHLEIRDHGVAINPYTVLPR